MAGAPLIPPALLRQAVDLAPAPGPRTRRDELAGTGASCSWADWKRVLERSWPGRVRTFTIRTASSGELLTEASMLRHDLKARGKEPHRAGRRYGRVDSDDVAALLAALFEEIGTFLAHSHEFTEGHEQILMPGDIPPSAIRDAPRELQRVIRILGS